MKKIKFHEIFLRNPLSAILALFISVTAFINGITDVVGKYFDNNFYIDIITVLLLSFVIYWIFVKIWKAFKQVNKDIITKYQSIPTLTKIPVKSFWEFLLDKAKVTANFIFLLGYLLVIMYTFNTLILSLTNFTYKWRLQEAVIYADTQRILNYDQDEEISIQYLDYCGRKIKSAKLPTKLTNWSIKTEGYLYFNYRPEKIEFKYVNNSGVYIAEITWDKMVEEGLMLDFDFTLNNK